MTFSSVPSNREAERSMFRIDQQHNSQVNMLLPHVNILLLLKIGNPDSNPLLPKVASYLLIQSFRSPEIENGEHLD